MRAWRVPLDEREGARLYWELSRLRAWSTGKKYPWHFRKLSLEQLLSMALLQSRYDPRLLAILVDFFRRQTVPLDPLVFKEEGRRADILAVSAVVCEWASAFGVSPSVQEKFDYWRAGVVPVPTQLFYVGLYPPGGRKMAEAVDHSPWPFKKWGFLAADPPLLKEHSPVRRVYLYDGAARFQILREMIRRQKRFRLKDYLGEIRFSVSRQQALQDLKGLPSIHKRGQGKGSYYVSSFS